MHAPRDVGLKAELEHDHPGQAERVPQAIDRRRDHAEILGDERQRAVESGGDRVEHRPPRAADPAPVDGRLRTRSHRPVRDKSPEVIDPGDVEQLQGPPRPLDPPPIAASAQRRPVIQRVAPQLTVIGKCVRRGTRDEPVLEQLRVSAVIDAPRRHVDRDVAEQPDPPILAISPQGGPFGVEANLVLDRAATAGEPAPVLDPERVAGDERIDLVGRHRRLGRRQEPWPGRKRRFRLVRRAVAVGRAER